MTDITTQIESSSSAIIKLWQRVPLVLRAVVTGYVVFAIAGTVAWMAILALVPIPWSLPVMWLVLFFYLKYFSGSWWPKSTAGIRAENFRAVKLTASTWKWSLFSALLIVAVIESGLVVTFRIVEFPAEAWNLGLQYESFPRGLVWLYIILMASVAGITEEVGFRGYMQAPLEKRYSPAAGIIFVALMFMLLHLNQAWAPVVLIHLFVIGTMWGVLAYVSGSVIPGIISHTIADVFSFSYWWTDVAGRFDKRPIAETGVDAHFIIWILVLVITTFLFVWAACKTRVARHSE